jgi:heme/copper-type cytochrome/quinol oxidase subunit 4
VAEVFKKALKAIVALKAIAVFAEVKTVINITYYLHVKRSVIFVTS